MNPILVSRFRSADVRSAATVLMQFTHRQPPIDELKKFLSAENHYFLAAEADGVWTGFAYAYVLSRPDGESMLFLYSLDVLPEFRRRGVATELLSYLRQIVEQRFLKELFVITACSNSGAVSFYRATGGMAEGGESLCFVYPSQNPEKSAP